jgi:hypothetical protein
MTARFITPTQLEIARAKSREDERAQERKERRGRPVAPSPSVPVSKWPWWRLE